MKKIQAAEYFADGLITGFTAVKDPMATGWLLSISGKAGKNWDYQTTAGKVRSFATLETLVKEVEEIGGFPVNALKISV